VNLLASKELVVVDGWNSWLHGWKEEEKKLLSVIIRGLGRGKSVYNIS
jgi:hypothetical protein